MQQRADSILYLLFAAWIAVALVAVYLAGLGPIQTGELCDSDCYMHLVRASELWLMGSWYDPVLERSNPPYGDRLHWTRPFDLLLLAGAVPGSVLVGFEPALFWWGVILSPLLLVASFMALRWALSPLLGDDGSAILGLLFGMQSAVLSVFQAGRPDHHGLLVLLLLVIVGSVLRLLDRPSSAGLSTLAGAISGLALWVSVESAVAVGIVLAILASLWITRGSPYQGASLRYSAALLGSTCLALVFERPWTALATVEVDRLSVAHAGVLGIVTVLWLCLILLARWSLLLGRARARLLAVFAAVSLSIICTAVLFPSLLRGPLGDVDPQLRARCIAGIQEMQPLLHSDVRWAWGLPMLGYGLCYPLIFLLNRTSRRDPRWVFLLAATLVFAVLSLLQARWTTYTQVLLLPPAAAMILRMRAAVQGRGLARLLAHCGITSAFLVLALSGVAVQSLTRPAAKSDACPGASVRMLCNYLRTDARWQGRTLRILTHPNFGAEILYRTPDQVIATLYHRNWQGLLATYDMLTAETDEQAYRQIRDRGIDLILLSPHADDSIFFSRPAAASTLYQRLCGSAVPEWCRPVDLPQGLAGFRLFEVRPESGPLPTES
jgi:asparagine N-glycosylation enzyme membrane subunit Stt3